MKNRFVELFLRWGFLSFCVGLVGGAGVVMADHLSITPQTAFFFSVAIAAIAIVTAKMGKEAYPVKDTYDVIVTLVSASTFLGGICVISFLGLVMVALTRSPSQLVYFILIVAEWILIYIFW